VLVVVNPLTYFLIFVVLGINFGSIVGTTYDTPTLFPNNVLSIPNAPAIISAIPNPATSQLDVTLN